MVSRGSVVVDLCVISGHGFKVEIGTGWCRCSFFGSFFDLLV